MPEVTAVDTMPTYNCRAGARTLPVAMGPLLAVRVAASQRVVCLARGEDRDAPSDQGADQARIGAGDDEWSGWSETWNVS